MVTEKKEEGGKEKKVPAASGQEKGGKEEKVSKESATGKDKKGKEKKDIKTEDKVVSKAQTHRIVRLLEYTLNGDKKVSAAIRDIKGIGYRIASILSKNLNMRDKLLADLTDDEISHLETDLKNVIAIVPSWMLNHQNDQFTGTNLHPVGTDLEIAVKNDIEFMQKTKTYKGIRHTQGQPVRGQRTRTSFRKGKSVGVVKKKSAPAKAGAKGEAEKKSAPAGKTAKK
ncbi:MAG: 30S ribosomal protein S13 [Candidatus Altiarchaeales archaeon A3]|nr:MAG: 30S ribosomal protein S13 [Candidatus Altiarchaeales archaeon A3]